MSLILFMVGDIDELGVRGAVLRGQTADIRAIAPLLDEPVRVLAAEVHGQIIEALREAKVQVEILQERLGIKDTGAGTLSIINTALASVEPHTEGVGA